MLGVWVSCLTQSVAQCSARRCLSRGRLRRIELASGGAETLDYTLLASLSGALKEGCRKSVLGVCLDYTDSAFAFMLLNVHGGEMAYQGRGQSGKGDRVIGSTAETARGPPPEQWKC